MPAVNRKGSNQLRIIGGEWRGRKLRFPDAPNLRPTPDRVRETIFNWLMPVIHGARCLDLFAGSGALGLESLSRGAASAVFVDSHPKVTQAIQSHLDLLNATDKAKVYQLDGIKYLQHDAEVFDVVFLDPPYQSDLLAGVIPLLESQGWLADNALLYLEIENKKTLPLLPENWHELKNKKAGDVSYHLYQRK